MKKVLVIVLCAFLLFIAGCGEQEESKPEPSEQKTTVDKDIPKQDSKDEQNQGIIKEPELPGAVLAMVDNYWKARPQSGLDKADLVYEIIAESGITRYMGIFYHEKADKIGPIRSARYYFVQLAKGYDSPLAHAGGSTEALNMLVSLKIKDLDEIYNASTFYWRDKNRKMPHNLYTSTERLIKGAKNKGYALVPLIGLPQGTKWQGDLQEKLCVDYSVGTYDYKVYWEYKENRYERKINDNPHLMDDGTPIKADNIVVITVKTKDIVKDGIVLSDVDIIGEGESCYFIDGKMMKGSWVKKSAGSSINFMDQYGSPMKFKIGKTWVQVIPSINKLILE